MSTSSDTQRQIDLYLAEVRRTLSDGTARENDAIIRELRAHIAETLRDRSPSKDEMSRILAELGDPREIATEARVVIPERGRRRTFRIAILALALALAGTGISIGEAVAHIGPPVPHYVAVPNVIGEGMVVAQRTILASGLFAVVHTHPTCSMLSTRGRVRGMIPAEGARVPEGSAVGLLVTTPERCTPGGQPTSTTSSS